MGLFHCGATKRQVLLRRWCCWGNSLHLEMVIFFSLTLMGMLLDVEGVACSIQGKLCLVGTADRSGRGQVGSPGPTVAVSGKDHVI